MPGVTDKAEIEKSEARKRAKKARPGGRPKLINIPKNWLHQALTYMDAGELGFRLAVELLEFVLVLLGLRVVFPELPMVWAAIVAIFAVHSWNWVTNGLFWSIIIFTFPGLKNPGPGKTVGYLQEMTARLKRYHCITGLLVYGSVSRGGWHDRSDIDIRILRRPGFVALIQAALLTMGERFIAFIARQPMDLFMADDVDFLAKMRADEKPLLLIKRDNRLEDFYPDNQEQEISIEHLTSVPVSSEG